jgi:tellurite resistance protein
VPPLQKFGDSLKDPVAAAARGKWLARGAWLLAAAEVVVAVRNHVSDRLTPKERKRMLEIVRSSKGRPSNLSDRERKELRALLGRVQPGELAKKVATSPFAGRMRARRH